MLHNKEEEKRLNRNRDKFHHVACRYIKVPPAPGKVQFTEGFTCSLGSLNNGLRPDKLFYLRRLFKEVANNNKLFCF